jgi:hypothetical protein
MAILKNTTINDTGFLQLPVGTTAQRPTPTNGKLRFNSNTGKVEFYNAVINAWIGTPELGVVATGGLIYDVDTEGTTYRVHVFTTTGNSTFTVAKGGQVEYLIVAGGGGANTAEGNPAGDGGGGGGAGGFLTGVLTATPNTYNVVVGAGGNLNNGSNSSVFGITAIGGGRGGGLRNNGVTSGGSGGGAGGNCVQSNRTGGAGTVGQGNRGGNDLAGSGNCSLRGGRGGGGAAQIGIDAASTSGTNGGNGIVSTITGIGVFYAGGGGGGPGSNTTGFGVGGIGGGGNGSNRSVFAQNGTPNTGGGAGGGSSGTPYTVAGLGASGIVIIRYPLRQENPTINIPKIAGDGLVLDLDFSKPTVYAGSGTVVNDSRLNGITGTLVNGPVFTDRRTQRSSFRFNGSNTHIPVVTLGTNNPLTQITVESWVYPRRAPSTGTLRGAAVSGHPSHYLGIFNSIDGGATHSLHWALQTSVTRPGSQVGSIPRFAWSYIVGTYDGTRMRAYINGVLLYDVALSGTISGDGRWMVGAYFPQPTDGTHNWDGEISTARIYNRALTQTEISNNFEATRWRFGV